MISVCQKKIFGVQKFFGEAARIYVTNFLMSAGFFLGNKGQKGPPKHQFFPLPRSRGEIMKKCPVKVCSPAYCAHTDHFSASGRPVFNFSSLSRATIFSELQP